MARPDRFPFRRFPSNTPCRATSAESLIITIRSRRVKDKRPIWSTILLHAKVYHPRLPSAARSLAKKIRFSERDAGEPASLKSPAASRRTFQCSCLYRVRRGRTPTFRCAQVYPASYSQIASSSVAFPSRPRFLSTSPFPITRTIRPGRKWLGEISLHTRTHSRTWNVTRLALTFEHSARYRFAFFLVAPRPQADGRHPAGFPAGERACFRLAKCVSHIFALIGISRTAAIGRRL